MDRIIALAGKKQSGKTEFAKVAQKYGYEIISFAGSLKGIAAELLGITQEEVTMLKTKKIDFLFTKSRCGKGLQN